MLNAPKSLPLLKAPFPWFGGKSLAAPLIWERFGSVGNYIEPFFGSGAVLLNAPEHCEFAATVNDLDGFVANFWRAIQATPEVVAKYANNQVNEVDLQARHQWLVNNRLQLTEQLKACPDWSDARIAGWWAWGCCSWIGSGWCADLNNGRGVNKKLPHLGNKGQGVNRQLSHLGNKGRGVNKHERREEWLCEWFANLQGRFRETRITCGGWERICSIGTITSFGVCGVLLDPPYGTTDEVYAMDSQSVSKDTQVWCIENGDNPLLRIALCGHVGQHECLERSGWVVECPDKGGGYQGADDRERIWFSPHCLSPKNSQMMLFN